MIKTNKIASGCYKGRYKYIDFTIIKVDSLPKNQIAWYWQIDNKKVNDWYSSKFKAIQALKEYIDEQ